MHNNWNKFAFTYILSDDNHQMSCCNNHFNASIDNLKAHFFSSTWKNHDSFIWMWWKLSQLKQELDEIRWMENKMEDCNSCKCLYLQKFGFFVLQVGSKLKYSDEISDLSKVYVCRKVYRHFILYNLSTFANLFPFWS